MLLTRIIIFITKELFINFVGGVLFIIIGAEVIDNYHGYRSGKEAQMALGCLCIIAGIIFLIDFLFAVKNTKFTVVRTTTRTI